MVATDEVSSLGATVLNQGAVVMKVLMVNSGVFPVPSPLGGTETHVYWLANSIAEAGCTVDLVADRGDAVFHRNVTVHSVGLNVNPEPPRHFLSYVTRHLWGGMLAARKAYALLKDASRSYDVVHSHGRWAPFFLSWSHRLPVVFTLHDSPPSPLLYKRGILNRLIYQGSYKALNLLTVRRADAVIAVSADCCEPLQRAGIPEKKLTVIPSGISTSLFSPGPRDPGRSPTFLFVGSLTPRKAVANLLWAFHKMDGDSNCVIAGDGPERSRLQQMAVDLGLGERVKFLGKRPMNEVATLYAAADVFVLPSLSEGIPICLLESMSAGCAVIATRVSGIPSVVTSGREGLLVEPGDVNMLADAMARLAADPEFRASAGRCGRAKMISEYSWAQIATRVMDVYRQALATGRHAMDCER